MLPDNDHALLPDLEGTYWRCWTCGDLCAYEDSVPAATVDPSPTVPWDGRCCDRCAKDAWCPDCESALDREGVCTNPRCSTFDPDDYRPDYGNLSSMKRGE